MSAVLDAPPARLFDRTFTAAPGTGGPAPAGTARPAREARGLSPAVVVGALLAYLAGVSALVLAGVYVPFLSPALGFGAAIGVPVALLLLGHVGLQESTDRSLTWNVPVALLALMAGGLVANTVGRWLAVAEPLGRLSCVITVDAVCVVLAAALWPRIRTRDRLHLPELSPADGRLLLAGVVLVAMAVMGATRLNNGAGGGLTLAMLAGVALVLAYAIVRAERLSVPALLGVLYLVGLALLLMTSLRGWYVTGHDVQREFIVFQLTATTHRWDMSAYQDAYNACLSVTILPTILQSWTGVEPAYVYKALYPLVFALCPVAVFHVAARVASRRVAVLATVFFMSFVTFFQDMPMLNRQAIGFLFLAGAFLALVDEDGSIMGRRAWFCVFGLGMALAHYSTTYVALGVFAGAFVLRTLATPLLVRGGIGRWRPLRAGPLGASPVQGPRALALVPIAVLLAVAYLWVGPVTQTERGVRGTVTSLVTSLRGGNADADKSSDVAYGLFTRNKVTSQQRLDRLEREDRENTAARRAAGEYYPLAEIDAHPTRAVEPAMLPFTALGATASQVADVPKLNATIRQGSAYALQLLLILGLAATVLGRRPLIAVAPEHLFLACAAVVVILVQIVAPVLSVEYGLLRTFQQALLLVDVYIVAGIAALGAPRRRGRAGGGGVGGGLRLLRVLDGDRPAGARRLRAAAAPQQRRHVLRDLLPPPRGDHRRGVAAQPDRGPGRAQHPVRGADRPVHVRPHAVAHAARHDERHPPRAGPQGRVRVPRVLERAAGGVDGGRCRRPRHVHLSRGVPRRQQGPRVQQRRRPCVPVSPEGAGPSAPARR